MDNLKKEFDKISGVKRTEIIQIDDNRILKVEWDGRPHDYNNILRDITNDYEYITPPKGHSKLTSDRMPIHYLMER